MSPRLVVDNTRKRKTPTDDELRKLAETALVRAADRTPLHVIVIADLGDGETAVWLSGLTRDEGIALAKTGVKLVLDTLTD